MRCVALLAFVALAVGCVSATSLSHSATFTRALSRARARTEMTALAEAGAEVQMARHELFAEATKGDDYDSGGCTPRTVWEKHAQGSEWWEWEKRLTDLAAKVKGLEGSKRAVAVFESMGENNYLQYIDGRSQYKGKTAFGDHYISDMTTAQKFYGDQITKGLTRQTFNEPFYDKLHEICFSQDAGKLKKRNGYRGPHSWVYLPMPDRPLGVYHNIHKNGRINFDPKLRKMLKNSEYKISGWKYNQRYQYRWQYPNLEIDYEKRIVSGLFNKFWDMIEAVKSSASEGEQRNLKLNAIVWLFHSLENFHCFIDGNGRTNLILMQGLLSWAGLHPISYYNSMESALTAVEEEREVVLEGLFKWEHAFTKGSTGWTDAEIDRKRQECQLASDQLLTPVKAGENRPWQPDTNGGCMCLDVKSCSENTYNGQEWCYTDENCFWKWDYCVAGRRVPGAKQPSS